MNAPCASFLLPCLFRSRQRVSFPTCNRTQRIPTAPGRQTVLYRHPSGAPQCDSGGNVKPMNAHVESCQCCPDDSRCTRVLGDHQHSDGRRTHSSVTPSPREGNWGESSGGSLAFRIKESPAARLLRLVRQHHRGRHPTRARLTRVIAFGVASALSPAAQSRPRSPKSG